MKKEKRNKIIWLPIVVAVCVLFITGHWLIALWLMFISLVFAFMQGVGNFRRYDDDI